jgi:stage II sporulation protein D
MLFSGDIAAVTAVVLFLSVLTVSAWLYAMSAACALEPEIKVRLFKSREPLSSVFLEGRFEILPPAANRICRGLFQLSRQDGKFKMAQVSPPGSRAFYICADELRLKPVAGMIAAGLTSNQLRHYRGTMTVRADGKKLVCRNQVSARDYIDAVVGSETRVEFPEEALKAQSVLIQTAMLRYKRNDDLNDSTEKQAYLGADWVRPAVREAVRKTWGEILTFDGCPLPVYFHSTCAGGTSTSELFTGKPGRLACDASVPCRYCMQSPFWKESKCRIPAAVIAAVFPEGLPEVKAKDRAGRPLLMEYAGSGREETGYQFWLKAGQRLGWGKMPGTRFEIRKRAGGDVELLSSGAGHGVGLCQWGAAGMGRRGLSYREILTYYFPGSRLQEP